MLLCAQRRWAPGAGYAGAANGALHDQHRAIDHALEADAKGIFRTTGVGPFRVSEGESSVGFFACDLSDGSDIGALGNREIDPFLYELSISQPIGVAYAAK